MSFHKTAIRKTASRKIMMAACVASAMLLPGAAAAADFSLSFDWGNIKRCTSGNPGSVANPVFRLKGLPANTDKIRFNMVDLDAPNFAHGGGTVKYAGKATIQPGAFKYRSPCPPSGRHTYQWTATALDAAGKKVAEAKARKQYP